MPGASPSGAKVKPLTLRRCQSGEQLPPNVSCASLCQMFPDCLPPPSPELISSVQRFWADGQTESENDQAVASTLRHLYEVISEGLEGRAP